MTITEEDWKTWGLSIGQYYIGISPDDTDVDLYQVIDITVEHHYKYADPNTIFSSEIYINSTQTFTVRNLKTNFILSFWYLTEIGRDDAWFRYYHVFGINIDIQGARPLMVIPKGATVKEALILLEASRPDLLKQIKENKKIE